MRRSASLAALSLLIAGVVSAQTPGLKLEATTAPVEVLVIDGAERPAED